MSRSTAAIASMAVGGTSLVAGIALLLGYASGLIALGVIFILVAVLLGWT